MAEIITKERILEAIEELKKNSKKRNFEQSVELVLSFKRIDMKKQENRKRGILFLPRGRGKDAEVAVIIPKKYASSFSDLGVDILYEEDLPNIDKRTAKKFAKRNDFILTVQESMPKVARFLGKYLGVRGKMPDPKYGMIIRNVDKEAEEVVKKFKEKAVRYYMKDNPSMTILVGSESQKNEDICENIQYVLDRIVDMLPEKSANIKSIFVKLTMSSPLKLY